MLRRLSVGAMLTRLAARSPAAAGIFRRWMTAGANTAVMSFGDGSIGALGLPSSFGADAYEPTRVPNLPPVMTAVAAGHYHSLAIDGDGRVWGWGRNEEGQLGRGPSSTREKWSSPEKVEGLDGVEVRAVFGSGVASMAIGDDGSLWVWGRSKRGQLGLGEGVTEAILPRRVEALAGEVIVKVSLGWGHVLALSKNGKLFGWGYAGEGRLGRIGLDGCSNELCKDVETAEQMVLRDMEKEKSMEICWIPSLLKEVDDQVIDIACGLDHSLVLCRGGKILSGGNNVYGQLGRAENASQGCLQEINTSLRATFVSAGLGHSLAVCRNMDPHSEGEGNCVVSWGWNCSSQLGREGPADFPRMVEGLEEEMPTMASCGRVHSLVLTSQRHVLVWGSGKNGRLGLGSSADETAPTLLDSLDEEVLHIASGFDHNLLLVTD